MNKTIVINYHNVYDQEPVFPGFRGVTTGDFLKQLAELKKRFDIISFAEYAADRSRPGRFCVLTFDDGLAEHYEIVFKILQQEKLSGTFFIPSKPYVEGELLNIHRVSMLTGKLGIGQFSRKFYPMAEKAGLEREVRTIIDTNEAYRYDAPEVRNFKFDLNYKIKYPILDQTLKEIFHEEFGSEQAIVKKLYMTEPQIKEMKQAGMVFGIHTHAHRILSRLTFAGQKTEITKAKNFLDKTLDYHSAFISYPFGMEGTVNQDTIAALPEAGIDFGLTMYRKINTGTEEPPLIHRFDVNDVFDDQGGLKSVYGTNH